MRPDERWDDAAWAGWEAALRDVELPEPDSTLAARCLPGEGALSGVAHRVLVVDDEPNLRRLVEVHLTRAGYEVRAAADGSECLEAVRAWRPSVVILDVMMPGISGFEVLNRLKGDPETADLLVVMLTARGEDDSVRRGWRTGADFYMGKPFNPEELRVVVDRLTALIGSPENPPPLRRWSK